MHSSKKKQILKSYILYLIQTAPLSYKEMSQVT